MIFIFQRVSNPFGLFYHKSNPLCSSNPMKKRILCELRVENTFLTTFNTNFIEFYELHEFFYSKY